MHVQYEEGCSNVLKKLAGAGSMWEFATKIQPGIPDQHMDFAIDYFPQHEATHPEPYTQTSSHQAAGFTTIQFFTTAVPSSNAAI